MSFFTWAPHLECSVMHKMLQKMWNVSSTVKHIHLAYVYTEKKWKSTAVECKNTFCVSGHYVFD